MKWILVPRRAAVHLHACLCSEQTETAEVNVRAGFQHVKRVRTRSDIDTLTVVIKTQLLLRSVLTSVRIH